MAADTPVILGASGKGGARPGSGAKKGQHRVHVKELKEAIENSIGQSFADIQATVFLKLFKDFQEDRNIKEFLIFNENMGRRILEQPTQEISVTGASELSEEELRARVSALLARNQAADNEQVSETNGPQE